MLVEEKLVDTFSKYKRAIFAAIIFEELLNEMASSLFAKELVVNMIGAYESLEIEDREFEAAQFALDDFANF